MTNTKKVPQKPFGLTSAAPATAAIPQPEVDNFTIHFDLSSNAENSDVVYMRRGALVNLIFKARCWPKEYNKVVWTDKPAGRGYVTAGKHATRQGVKTACLVLSRAGLVQPYSAGPPMFEVGVYPVGVKPLIDLAMGPTRAEKGAWTLWRMAGVDPTPPWRFPEIEGDNTDLGVHRNQRYGYVEAGGPGTGKWARLEVVHAEGVDFVMVKPKPLPPPTPIVPPNVPDKTAMD